MNTHGDGAQASDQERLEALSYLVEVLIIGQWARSRDPLARARADVKAADARLNEPHINLSVGARLEVARLLRDSMRRLDREAEQ